jgi:hypothetical protein
MQPYTTNPQAPSPVILDRRSTPRVEVISRLQGAATTGEAVLLINISEGGAMVHGDFPAQEGEVHEFRFCPEDGDAPLIFAARVARVLSIAAPRGTTYALGLEFVTGTDRQRRAIDALIARGLTAETRKPA